MPIAVRHDRAESASEPARTIALTKGGAVAPFVRRPSAGLGLGTRRPARRLPEAFGVPAVSRIVLRPLTPR
jgi:hypothetical protein